MSKNCQKNFIKTHFSYIVQSHFLLRLPPELCLLKCENCFLVVEVITKWAHWAQLIQHDKISFSHTTTGSQRAQNHIKPATAGMSHHYWSRDRSGEDERGTGGLIRSSFNQKCEPQHQISIWWVRVLNQTFTQQLWSQRAQLRKTLQMYILEMYHLLMKVFLFLFGPSRLGLILRQDTLMIFPFQLSISVSVTWAQHGVPELIGSPIRESDLNQQTSRYWRKHEMEQHPHSLSYKQRPKHMLGNRLDH